jgi:tight adherence protein B
MSKLQLLVFACAGVIALASSGLFAAELLRHRDRLQLRIRVATGPYKRWAGDGDFAGSGVALEEASQGLARRTAMLFGFDPLLRDHYLISWWLALLVGLVCALGIERLVALMVGELTLVAVLPLWIVLCRSFFKWCEERRRAKLFLQFPDALAMIVRAVRVGIPVTDAIRAVGSESPAPTGPEFARVADELNIGAVLEPTLQSMAARSGLPEYGFFATTLTLQNQTGGGLSETLENLAEVIRKRTAVRQRGEALSAEAKTSAIVLGLLPPFAALGLWFLNPGYVALLVTDPIGKRILALAIGCLVGGALTMRTMIRRSLS